MNEEMLIIDFGQLGGPSFVGRDRGAAMRSQLNIDGKEGTYNEITVAIPDYIFTVSSSYFLGLFETSIKKAKTAEKFFLKFRFECPEFLLKDFEKNVHRTLESGKKIL